MMPTNSPRKSLCRPEPASVGEGPAFRTFSAPPLVTVITGGARDFLRNVLTFALLAAVFVPFARAQAAPQSQAPQPQATTGGKPTPLKGVAPSQPKPWLQIPVPPLPPFHPQQPKRVQLANGMVIFLQEDHELPTIDGTMRIRGGSLLEPPAKTGLVDMYGDVWRTGGTKTMTGDQLDDFLEARAAKVETDGGLDSTSISFSCLKGDFDDVFKIYLDVLNNPAFREDKLALAKRQMNTGISRRNDDIGEIAGRESTRLAYGPDNPYSRIPQYWTVTAVSVEDLGQWHAKFVHPNNIIMGIVGDFDSNQMEARLRQAFESWPAGPPAPKPAVQFHEPKPGIYFVDKEDVDQSAIRMVMLGIRRDNPDYYPVEALNEVMGGGFSSRLFVDIRTKKGLAYSVGGGVGASYDHPGIFRLSMGTKSGSTVEALKALDEELANLVTNPPTAEELKRAKDSILNSFIFNFDSKSKVLRERMAYEFYGYPADFLERYRAGIEKATTADVARVAEKYIHPKQFAVLVVGNQKEFGEKLSSLGPVIPIDITIPTAPPGQQQGAAPATPAASNPAGRELLNKVIEALGGSAKVNAVKALRESTMSTANTPQGEMQIKREILVAYPDRLRVNMQMPQGEALLVVTPTDAFLSMAQTGVRPMPEPLKEQIVNGLRRDPIAVVQHANDPKYTFTAGPSETIKGVSAAALDIDADGAKVRWWVDPQSGHILRMEFDAITQQGPAKHTEDLSDWKLVDGVSFAFKRTGTDNGQPAGSEDVQQIQVNPPVDPKAFEKPAS